MKSRRAGIAVFAVVFLWMATSGCAAMKAGDKEGREGMTGKNVQAVLERHKNELMAIRGVVGVAEGRCEGEPCIKVYVIEKTPETAGKIPSRIEGVAVGVEQTGEFKARPEDD